MSISCYWNEVIGVVKRNGYDYWMYTGGNVPAVICYDHTDENGEKWHDMVSFIADKQHFENMLKDGCFDGFSDWKLNTEFNRDAFMIAKLLTKYGHSVTLSDWRIKREV